MTPPRKDEIRIATEAAEWQQRLKRAGAPERAQFVDWVRASPRHLQEFLYMEALEAATEKPDPERHIDVEKLLAETSANVVSMTPAPASLPARFRGRSPWLAGLAAALAVAVLTGWLIGRSSGIYATDVGEQRAIELDDGSVLELNARSRVQTHLSNDAREVDLLEGEALFKVAHDPARPFRVHAGETTIRAIGTQFNVYRRANGTSVAVLEGKVAVTPGSRSHSRQEEQLAAGEEARIGESGAITRKPLDPVEVSAWRQRRLVFRDDTLEDIAAEFNRYNRRPRIRVEGHARARRFGGTFDADDPQSITQVLAGSPSLAIERTADAIVIRPR